MQILKHRKKLITAAILVLSLVVGVSVHFGIAKAANSQVITLSPGWNVISTPRVLTNHTFSTAETSDNFDILVLNAASTAGWSTMAELGQTELAPLYGYFINNKTTSTQTLTLNFKDTLTMQPSELSFERIFTKAGWYSIGVANPTFSKLQNADTSTIDNVTNILLSLNDSIGSVIDFSSPTSVKMQNTWMTANQGSLNTLNDLRETKGYAVYLSKDAGLYDGFQNINGVPTIASVAPAQIVGGSPATTVTVKGTNFTSTSKVLWNGSQRVTSYVSSTTLKATITATDLVAVGFAKISVYSPQANATSSEVDLVIIPNVVYTGTLSVNNLSTLPTQNVQVGSTTVTLANIQLKAEFETMSVASLMFTDTVSAGAMNGEIGDLAIYDANGTRLSSASNLGTASTTFVFATPLLIPGSSTSTLTLKGDVLARVAAGTHTFHIVAPGDVVSYGVSSGSWITPTVSGVGLPITIVTSTP